MIAVLYDVHGNLPALEAVLADAGAVDGFVLGGDYALFGAWPAETLDTLAALAPATRIRGNVDRWTASPADAPDNPVVQGAIEACRGAVSRAVVADLASLRPEAVIDGTRYCHASPISDLESFTPEPSDDDLRLLGGAAEGRVVFGHTHLQFRRLGPGGVELVNPGSVGIPLDGDHRSAYALLHEDGSIEHRRVAYDHEASAAALSDRFGESEWTETIARRLRTARF